MVRHCEPFSSEQLATSLWPGEKYDGIALQKSLLRFILYSSQGAILHHYRRKGRGGRRLASFWRMMQLYEHVLLEQQMQADYFTALLDGLQPFVSLFSRQAQRFSDEEERRRVLLDKRTPEYLCGMQQCRRQPGQFSQRIQAGFAFWFGLVMQQQETLASLQAWEAENCVNQTDLFTKWAEVAPLLYSVLLAYQPVDPAWIMAQKGEPTQCLLKVLGSN